MTSLVPTKLILDISTLSATTTREWLGFSRVGHCYIPHVVYEEIRFLYERSPDPDLERVSREFTRFYGSSGWKVSEITGHHPLLKSATGHALTKRARVALAVARCAYGEAKKNPKQLIVLVTSDRTILQRIYDVQVPNLAGIPSSALLNWSRSGKRPVAVTQKFQELKDLKELGYSQSGLIGHSYQPTTPTRTTTSHRSITSRRPTRTQTYQTNRVPTRQTRVSSKRSPSRTAQRSSSLGYRKGKAGKVTRYIPAVPTWVPQFVSLLSAFVALAIAGFIIWVMFGTSYLEQFLPQDETPVSARIIISPE